jgi:hypothetical protein
MKPTGDPELDAKIAVSLVGKRSEREKWETDLPALDRTFGAVDGNLKNAMGKKKAQIQLFPAAGIIVGSDAMAEGAEKYGPYNWRSGKVELMQYLRAILAHTYALLDGEDLDPESATGKSHLSGILASAAIIADADVIGVLVDDRPPKGEAGEQLRLRGPGAGACAH